jgi:hypothetical protein
MITVINGEAEVASLGNTMSGVAKDAGVARCTVGDGLQDAR